MNPKSEVDFCKQSLTLNLKLEVDFRKSFKIES